MKKNIAVRFWVGFAGGVLCGDLVNFLISLGVGGGTYLSAMPQLIAWCGSETAAVAVQWTLTGLIGVTFAEGSLVFLVERWSFLRQCILHFAVTAIIYMPFVYLCWAPKHFTDVLVVLANVLFTYTLTWLIQYSANRRAVKQINARLSELRGHPAAKPPLGKE